MWMWFPYFPPNIFALLSRSVRRAMREGTWVKL